LCGTITGATNAIQNRRVFEEIQRSNMSKLGKDGKPITGRWESLKGAKLFLNQYSLIFWNKK